MTDHDHAPLLVRTESPVDGLEFIFYKFPGEDACSYCGQVANQVDHVHPQAASPEESNGHTLGLKVPACGECNRLAGCEIFPSVAQKREWVHRKLRKKYRRILHIPTWTEDEKDELGPNLRKRLEAELQLQWITRQRIRYKCDGRCGESA